MGLDAVNQIGAHLSQMEADFRALWDTVEHDGLSTLAQRYHALYSRPDILDFKQAQELTGHLKGKSVRPTIAKVLIYGEIFAEWVYPGACKNNSRILYLHGGGWCDGQASVYRHLATQIALATNCPVLVPQYRTAPKHRYPAALADCLAAYAYALVFGPDGRTLPAKVIVIGDSVGGNLAIALSFSLKQRNLHLPAALVGLSPVCDCEQPDLQSRSHMVAARWIEQCIGNYLQGGADSRMPTVSPVRADLSSLPPLLVQVGELDPVREECIELVNRAKRAGVRVSLLVVPEMVHAFQRFAPAIPEAKRAIEHLASFISSMDTSQHRDSKVVYPKIWQTKHCQDDRQA